MKSTAAGLVFGGLIFTGWTAASSYVFLIGTGLLSDYPGPLDASWQWLRYAIWYRDNLIVEKWLLYSGAGCGAAFALIGLFSAIRFKRVHAPSLKKEPGDRQLIRGVTDNHGHADWMPMKQVRDVFSGTQGIIVAEAYRVDQDPIAKAFPLFDPRDKATWGQGGKASLLVDDCTRGPTHGIMISGSGGFKTQTAATTLIHPQGWPGSVVVLDPSAELGPMSRDARAMRGQRVVQLYPGAKDGKRLENDKDADPTVTGDGVNVLAWINPKVSSAETDVEAIVGLVYREAAGRQGDPKDDFFSDMGRQLVICLTAHLLWLDLPPEEKNLRRVRAGLTMPIEQMRELLKAIHLHSNSGMARDIAGSLKDIVADTFDGIYTNAFKGTSWLSNRAYANLVSGNAFKLSDLVKGNLAIYIQVPLKALMETPAVGRVLIGSLLRAVYEDDGKSARRTLFLLDEAKELGPMPQLAQARETARKYGATLVMLYQSVGQIEQVWGRDGAQAWFDSVSWRSYAAIRSPQTAKALSDEIGQYGVMATSEGSNSGRSAQGLGIGNRSKGQNQSHHEISRKLIYPDEIQSDMRDDEQIVIARGRAMRLGRPIVFRRADLVGKVGANRFFKQHEPEPNSYWKAILK